MSRPRTSLDSLFTPASVAVIGATESAVKMGGRRWKTLVEGGFDGTIHPVHPTAKEVRGVPAYRSIAQVPGPVDLAVVIVPPDAALDVARQCAASGVGAIAMIGAGFAETGAQGEALERELVTIVREAGIRMVGPNCAGVFSASCGMNTIGWDVPGGSVGLVSQSGNVALDLSTLAKRTGGGFSRYVTIGNAADVRSVELLDYLLDDEATHSIIVYMEGWSDGEGRAFFSRLREGVPVKPVIVIQAGRTASGRKSALSHTRSLAGQSRIVESCLLQAGAILAESVEEAWELARSLPLLRPFPGTGIAVLSDGGGHATLLADAIELAGLRVPELSAATQEMLGRVLPSRCPVANPIDFAGESEGNPDIIAQALEIVLGCSEVDAAIVAGHFGGYCDLGGESMTPLERNAAATLADLIERSGKTVIVHSIHAGRNTPALDALDASGVVLCRSIRDAARLMAAAHSLSGGGSNHDGVAAAGQPAAKHRTPAPADGGRWLLESEGRDLLASLGVAMPPHRVAETAQDCIEALKAFRCPVAMKVLSEGVIHKSDVGGVALGIADADEARRAFDHLAAAVEGCRILITPMIGDGIETIVGAFRDAQFGPMVMFGLGGVWVEDMDDVAFRAAPVTLAEATGMIDGIRGAAVLRGRRGKPAVDRCAAAHLVQRISLIIAGEDMEELELNPVILRPEGALIADVRIRARSRQ